MSGDWPLEGGWPPEWDDPEEFPEGAAGQDTEALAGLSEVTAFLASVPASPLPDAVTARISAALAAEAAARAGDPVHPASDARRGLPETDAVSAAAGPADAATAAGTAASAGAPSPAADARTLGPAPARARVRRRRDGRPRGFRVRPLVAVWSVIGCLVLVGLGVVLTLGRSPSSSGSSGFSAAGSNAGQSAAVAAPNASAPVPSESSSSAVASSSAAASFAGTVPFTVTASGTRYEAATLAAQVRARLHLPASAGTTADHGPGSAPTPALHGCVVHLTGGLPPRLVDRATYQGAPAYVIATSSRVWVVRPGCTAASPELITSAALAG